MRIGSGYDIHVLVPGRPLMLGGIRIPSDKGEMAHSEGDVLIHALIDAILGAYAKGDIGSHFPPSDEQWKDADSRTLLSMVLDECIPYPCEKQKVIKSVERTLRWAKRCKDEYLRLGLPQRGILSFGIVQGGCYDDIRKRCAESLAELDFPGYAIGGVSVGEPEPQMLEQVEASASGLPFDKPRYVMGVGTPPQLLKMIALGADMFDCVMPTRLARHAVAFTPDGPINLKNAKFAEDSSPLDNETGGYSSKFSRAYIRHLVKANEMLACTLISMHNIRFFQNLMQKAREAIECGNYEQWSAETIARYESSENDK